MAACLVSSGVLCAEALAQRADDTTGDRCSQEHPAVFVQAGDRLACDRLGYLAARSATMQQMLRVLQKIPGVLVQLRSKRTLWRSGRTGHGRLLVTSNAIVAILEFDSGRSEPFQQIEAVAHEMAHAVEIACLPELATIERYDQLRRALVARGRSELQHRETLVETKFATEAGGLVLQEAARRRSHAGEFHALAIRHGLAPPCTVRGTALEEVTSALRPPRDP